MIPTTGMYYHRLTAEADNPRERAFAEQWAIENDERSYRRGPLLTVLIPDITDREAIVVATIIQWLGSNVGFSFLCEALDKAGYRIQAKDEK